MLNAVVLLALLPLPPGAQVWTKPTEPSLLCGQPYEAMWTHTHCLFEVAELKLIFPGSLFLIVLWHSWGLLQ